MQMVPFFFQQKAAQNQLDSLKYRWHESMLLGYLSQNEPAGHQVCRVIETQENQASYEIFLKEIFIVKSEFSDIDCIFQNRNPMDITTTVVFTNAL